MTFLFFASPCNEISIIAYNMTKQNLSMKLPIMQVVREQCADIPGQECNVIETEVCEQVEEVKQLL